MVLAQIVDDDLHAGAMRLHDLEHREVAPCLDPDELTLFGRPRLVRRGRQGHGQRAEHGERGCKAQAASHGRLRSVAIAGNLPGKCEEKMAASGGSRATMPMPMPMPLTLP